MPAWPASYVVALANHTGWKEHFILWELPLARGLQYQHAILCANGIKTGPTTDGMQKALFDIEKDLEEKFNSWQPT